LSVENDTALGMLNHLAGLLQILMQTTESPDEG
jgi:hypothetical protein